MPNSRFALGFVHDGVFNAASIQVGTVGAAGETFISIASFWREVGTFDDRFEVGRFSDVVMCAQLRVQLQTWLPKI